MMNIAHLHAAVVHFPIALLLLGSVAALLYLWGWRRSELPPLSWITLGLGWIATGAAILTGLLAQAGLPPQAPYRAVLNWHIGTGMALLVVYATLLYRGWLFRQRSRQRKHKDSRQEERRPARAHTQPDQAGDLLDDPGSRLLVTILLVIGIALVVASGWNGGNLVYTWGVNVGT